MNRRRGILCMAALCISGSVPAAGAVKVLRLENVTVSELERDYRAHRRSVSDVISWHLSQIARCQPLFNPLSGVFAQDALARAALLDRQAADNRYERGRLWGVPVVIKANTNIAGEITSNGWKGYTIPGLELRPQTDADVVHALREAGAILIGQSNMPDFADSDSNVGSVGGRTGNAFDARYSPGGSSGGSAVAVSLGLAVVAEGTDTGNSIRNPAANAAVVGMVPTQGLLSTAGIHPFDWLRDVPGPLTRTVSDAAIMLEVLAAPRQRSANFTRLLKTDALRGRRFGVPSFVLDGMPRTHSTQPWYGGTSPEARAAFMHSVAALEHAGAIVVFDSDLLPEPFVELVQRIHSERYRRQGLDLYLERYGPPAYRSADAFESISGWRLPSNLFGDARYRYTLNTDPEAEREYRGPRRLASRWIADTLERFHLDGFIYPPLQVPPNDETRPLPKNYPSDGPYSATAWINRLGLPAITVPAGRYASGLPYGVEFAAAWSEDAKLLSYAFAFEHLTRARREPAGCGSP